MIPSGAFGVKLEGRTADGQPEHDNEDRGQESSADHQNVTLTGQLIGVFNLFVDVKMIIACSTQISYRPGKFVETMTVGVNAGGQILRSEPSDRFRVEGLDAILSKVISREDCLLFAYVECV